MKTTQQSTGATYQLAAWSATVDRQWSQAELQAANMAFIDTIAVMLAGASHAPQQAFANAIRRLDGGNGASTLVGRSFRLSAPWAALANGCAAHHLDFDDVLDPSMSHPSAVLVPAILALAQANANSGHDCLDAYIVGLEVLARLGEAMNLAHYANGWHATSTLGTMAAGAACARLLGLDTHHTQMAISLASSMAGGSKCQFGTFAKPMHAGMAAKNGILAAHLASMGTEAIDEPLEGPWGYVALTCGDEAPGFARTLQTLGKPTAILRHGVSIKLYPCCSSTHRPIDALLTILQQHRINQTSVSRIEVHISAIAARNLRYHQPVTPAQARFSLEYCLAVALHNGKGPSLADFEPQAVLDQDVQALLPMMDIHVDSQLAARGPVGEAPDRIHLVVHLQDGSQLSQYMDHPLGHPTNPIDLETLRHKFNSCLPDSFTASQSEQLWMQLRNLAALPKIDDVMALL